MNDVAIMWIPCKSNEPNFTELLDITYEDYLKRNGEQTGYLEIAARDYRKLGLHIVWHAFNAEDIQEGYRYPLKVEIVPFKEYSARWGQPRQYLIGVAVKK